MLGGSPARLTGRACFAIAFAEADEPVRFCNRYVSDVADALGAGNVVAGAASTDLLEALALVDTFKAREVHVTGVDVDVQIARGQRQAFLRSVRLPRRGRAGKKVARDAGAAPRPRALSSGARSASGCRPTCVRASAASSSPA